MKKLLFLALLFAGLAAFVYFYEIEGQEAREKAQELEESLFRVEQDAVTRIEIEVGSETPVVLEREGENWMIREPIQAAADSAGVDSLLGSIESARRERTLREDEAGSPEEYGLVEPRAVLRVTTAEGTQVLSLGSEGYTGSQIYATFEGSPEVYLTGTSLLTSADKELMDWRNKDALTFARTAVEEIEIERPGEDIRLVKEEDDWNLAQPVEEPADQTTVSTLLSTLETTDIEEFVAEDGEDLGQYGLAESPLRVRLREEGSESWSVLELGDAVDGSFYARNPRRDPIFKLPASVRDELSRQLWDFRGKDVVDVEQSEVERLTIRRAEEEIVLVQEDFQWVVEAPEEFAGREVPSYQLWYPIDDIELTAIADAPAELQETVEVVAGLVSGSEHTYRFGRAGDEIMALQVDSGRWGIVSQEDFDKLQFDLAEIAEEATEE